MSAADPPPAPEDLPDRPGMPHGRRTVPAGAFSDDRGEADPALREALSGLGDRPDSATEQALMRRVAAARWLVPAVAVPVDAQAPDRHDPSRHHDHDHDHHHDHDRHAHDGPGGEPARVATQMSAVTLTGQDGRRALLVFTGLDSLAEWDPQARPVPVTARTAAQAAVSEGCDVLVVDLASAHATELRPSMVWALAQDRPWLPAHEDPFVAAAVARAGADEPDVARHTLQAGPAGGLVVTLALRPGLDADGVAALATRVGERLATDGELRARVDGLAFRVVPA
ncbi:MAG: SseB family protein [Dermatophilaceae bacterium]